MALRAWTTACAGIQALVVRQQATIREVISDLFLKLGMHTSKTLGFKEDAIQPTFAPSVLMIVDETERYGMKHFIPKLSWTFILSRLFAQVRVGITPSCRDCPLFTTLRNIFPVFCLWSVSDVWT